MELRNLKILAFLLFVHLFETTQLEKMLTNGNSRSLVSYHPTECAHLPNWNDFKAFVL